MMPARHVPLSQRLQVPTVPLTCHPSHPFKHRPLQPPKLLLMNIMAFIFASARRLLHSYLSTRTRIRSFTLVPGLLCLYLVFRTYYHGPHQRSARVWATLPWVMGKGACRYRYGLSALTFILDTLAKLSM